MSKKKVIDVLAPQDVKIEQVELKPKVVKYDKPAKKVKDKKEGKSKKLLVLSVLVFVLLAFIAYVSLLRVEINLWPQVEKVNIENSFIIDSEEGVILSHVFEKDKTIVETFSSTGTVLKEEKARGIIKVYNEYSTADQVLIATTRFVDEKGNLFRTPVAVTIPGGHYEGRKLIPGEIEIEVIADQPGAEYNIGPSSFSIPGFAGTDKQMKFYAKSFSSMEGGVSEEKAVVTKEDLIRAENDLLEKARQECEKLLKSELESEVISLNFHYPKDKLKTEIVEKFALSSEGEEVTEFKYQVKASCQTLLFSKEDLSNYVDSLILEEVEKDYDIYRESLEVDYVFDSIDLDLNRAEVSLNASATVYAKVEEDSLKNALVGKSLLETKLFLENQLKVDKVSVRFWPFWVKKVPDKLNKINIILNINSY